MTSQNKIKKLYKSSERIIFIGGAIVFSKIVFLIIPYLITGVEYNEFNKIYYSAAIIILIGKFGFEFAITRIEIHYKKLFAAIFFNVLIVSIFVTAIGEKYISLKSYLSILLYSYFYIAANIFLIKNLFEGAYKKYFLYKLFYGFTLLISLLVLLKFSTNIFLIFPFVGFLWFLFVYSFNWKNYSGNGKLKSFYKLGTSAFIINSALGFAFIADKYIVNHFFEVEIANAYTFAWALTSPMLYIGSMIEHSIFTSSNKNKRKTITKFLFLLASMVLAYSIIIFTGVHFYSSLLPKSISYNYFISILSIFLLIYSVYTFVQFPLNGILFKFIDSKAQFRLSKIYPVLFIVFVAILYFVFIHNMNKNYFLLITLNAGYLFVLLLLKAFVVFKSVPKVVLK